VPWPRRQPGSQRVELGVENAKRHWQRGCGAAIISVKMKHYHLTAVIWKEGKHYVSKCPELGVASYGMTPEKARTALEEGVELYISNAKKLGLLKDVEPAISSEARYTAALNIAFA
jgi:predicted RNase H-like HicB family nuclease